MIAELPVEKRELRDVARGFLAQHCPEEFARACDENETFPWELFKKLGELGWTGIPFAEEYGGSEGDELDEVTVVEQMGYAMMPLAAAYLVTVLTCGKTIRDLGTDEQKARWLPMICAGEGLVAYALTEPQAGSDAARIRTRAERTAGGWRLNGQKTFCTGSGIAEVMLVMARTGDPDSAHGGISMFLVDPKADGVAHHKLPKLGLRPYPTYEVFFQDVELPEDALLGEVDGAWRHLVKSLNRERIACAAMCTGTAQAALDYAMSYAQGREQFGVPISTFQAIRHKLVDAHLQVDGARLLTYHAAWLETQGESSVAAASAAKVWATEAAVDVSRDGMQVLGGYSYMLEYPMQRFLRDSLIHPIGAGTNEIQRNIIAKEILR
jgi:alkylation response protein AidB-like acyl-CoA dehydrogenase